MADIVTEINKLTKEQVESKESEPVMVAPAEPTKEEILAVAALLQRKDNNGGFRKIADTTGVKLVHVKNIYQAMRARLAELEVEVGP